MLSLYFGFASKNPQLKKSIKISLLGHTSSKAFAKNFGRSHFPSSNYLAIMIMLRILPPLRHFKGMFNFSYQEHNSQKIEYILRLCRILKLFIFYLIKIHIHNSKFTYLVSSILPAFPFGCSFNSSLVYTWSCSKNKTRWAICFFTLSITFELTVQRWIIDYLCISLTLMLLPSLQPTFLNSQAPAHIHSKSSRYKISATLEPPKMHPFPLISFMLTTGHQKHHLTKITKIFNVYRYFYLIQQQTFYYTYTRVARVSIPTCNVN